MNDSRTKNSTRNIIFSLFAYLIQIILGFFVRRYFIFYFGEEYLGLSSVFTNVLSFLSLAELGFGTAIVFSMYKPMAEGDDETVRQLLQFYKKCYFIIAVIVIVLGLLIIPFMSYFEKQAPNVEVNFYLVYLIFLMNSVVSYFFAHRRSLLYTSQRNDLESKVNIILNIVLAGLQLVAICLAKNYYIYILLSGIISIINNLFIFIITQKKYSKFLQKPSGSLDKETRKTINKNVYSMVFHKIGTIAVYSTDSLVIFLILGAMSLGKYSNYLLVTTYVSSIIAIFTGALRGSIGNSIASESVEKNKELLKRLNFIYFFIVSFATIAIYVLVDPFIDVVLTHSDTTSLVLDKTVLILICINFFLTQSRYMVGIFKECAGLYYQDRFKSLIESGINLVVSIILAYYIGLAGVIMGTIISNIMTSLWIEPYILNKYYFKQSTLKYFGKYALYALAMLVSAIVTTFVCNFINVAGFWTLILKGIVCCMVAGTMLLITMCPHKEFRDNLSWGKEIIKNLRRSK